ncbi:heavy metal translocating P-type ATPase [Shewanella schlegeliana]|uniref:Copper-exporting P-type ATPase n=1 Tax=Shewanella schlegeliana TaxID=190308 RepID=A0ABS1SXS4_9GAMM|nr:heavy metal translocating P-type ATPase [Shewanella schlegeliana]MBL4913327.1 copper-translocating P-type ATPase [Shewanella schlegeliana]MCL1109282.1 heavy metal translocating P-type ATPase [Shewanella schlegeliana]GIU24716.1 copper-translocating P-type ATPase [Shewanella schlegeliana]
MANINLYVPKMSCASCVAKIESAFDKVNKDLPDGKSHHLSARVNLADKLVLVSGEITAKQAIAIVSSVGYDSELVIDAQTAAMQKNDDEHKEYRLRLIQAAIGLGLGVPLMLWGLLGGEMMVNNATQQFAWGIVGIITLLVMVLTGRHFFQGMWRAIKAKTANMDTLIALGTSAAWIYSMMVVIEPQWFPADTRHVYFEASVMILGLINLGHALELRARGKTSEAVQRLLGLQATTAIRVSDRGDEEVEINQLKVGDRLRLRPGDRVALDGEVLNGETFINESMLTGEPIPVHKVVGDIINAGTVNGNGALIYRATASAQDTKLSKIIELVQQAQTSKMPIGRLTDKISAYFVPVVVVIALLSSSLWYLFGPEPALSHALVVLTSVLIIACPCALGLATPMSIMVSVGRAAQMGVLIRNGEALQTASKVTTVVLDKTGTITAGKPEVSKVVMLQSELNELSLLTDIAALEQHSEHPLASAIIEKAKAVAVKFVEPESFTNIQGKGIVGSVNGKYYSIGNLSLMHQAGIDNLADYQQQISEFANQGQTPVFVASDKQLLAIIAIADPIKDDAVQAVQKMLQAGFKLVLLTGDNQQTARAVADKVGITTVFAEVLPEDKQSKVIELQQAGEVVAMVGDGINDAPALMSADVGLAMGSGTEIAIESADFTLLSTRLLVIADTLLLAKASMRNIKQNLFGAFIYNTLGIPIAAGVLFPFTGLLLSPVIAGAAMALSSLTVVSNANRLRGVALS